MTPQQAECPQDGYERMWWQRHSPVHATAPIVCPTCHNTRPDYDLCSDPYHVAGTAPIEAQEAKNYNMGEVHLCRNCNGMKHLNTSGLCGRCTPHPDAQEATSRVTIDVPEGTEIYNLTPHKVVIEPPHPEATHMAEVHGIKAEFDANPNPKGKTLDEFVAEHPGLEATQGDELDGLTVTDSNDPGVYFEPYIGAPNKWGHVVTKHQAIPFLLETLKKLDKRVKALEENR